MADQSLEQLRAQTIATFSASIAKAQAFAVSHANEYVVVQESGLLPLRVRGDNTIGIFGGEYWHAARRTVAQRLADKFTAKMAAHLVAEPKCVVMLAHEWAKAFTESTNKMIEVVRAQ